MKLILTFTLAFTLFLTASGLAQSSNGVVRGTVNSTNQQPLFGINIHVERTNLGTSTDSKGQFELRNVPPGKHTLLVSGIGFESLKKEFSISANETLSFDLALNQEVTELNEVVVFTNTDDNYYQNVTSSSKISTDLLSLPKSVQVLTAQMLRDQQTILLHDVMINVSGVSSRSTTNDFTMRGYNNGGGSSGGSIAFINGMRNQFTPYENEMVLFNVENIEFIKGPASVLYGTNQPGGMINVVTKKPQPENAIATSLAVTSWGGFRLENDITGTLSTNKKWLYRLNSAIYKAPDHRDFFYKNTFGVAPALSFIPNERTRIDLEFMYTRTNRLTWYDWGITSVNGNTEALPLDYTPHEPTDFVNWENSALFADLSHTLTKTVTLRSSFMGSGNNNNGEVHAPEFFNPAPDDMGNVSRNFRRIRYNNSAFFLTNYLDIKLSTGTIKHNLVVGIDVFDSKRSGDIQQAGATEGVPLINVFDPVYRQASVGSYDLSGGFYSFDRTNYIGSYIQNLIEIGSQIKVMLGIRYESYTFKSLPSLAPNDSDPFTPNLGVVYSPKKDLSFYATYSEGFVPQNNQSPDRGGPFEPELSEQIELGIKKDLLDKKLNATFSVYQITRKNQLVPDPNNQGIRLPIGETESRGAEIDILGKLTSSLNLILNYAYNDVEITESTREGAIGSRLANAPKHTSNIWAKYFFGASNKTGFSAALGIENRSSILAGDNTPLSGYSIFNSALYYSWEGAQLSLNWQNMLNERYYVGASNQYYLQPGTPGNLMLRISTNL